MAALEEVVQLVVNACCEHPPEAYPINPTSLLYCHGDRGHREERVPQRCCRGVDHETPGQAEIPHGIQHA